MDDNFLTPPVSSHDGSSFHSGITNNLGISSLHSPTNNRISFAITDYSFPSNTLKTAPQELNTALSPRQYRTNTLQSMTWQGNKRKRFYDENSSNSYTPYDCNSLATTKIDSISVINNDNNSILVKNNSHRLDALSAISSHVTYQNVTYMNTYQNADSASHVFMETQKTVVRSKNLEPLSVCTCTDDSHSCNSLNHIPHELAQDTEMDSGSTIYIRGMAKHLARQPITHNLHSDDIIEDKFKTLPHTKNHDTNSSTLHHSGFNNLAYHNDEHKLSVTENIQLEFEGSANSESMEDLKHANCMTRFRPHMIPCLTLLIASLLAALVLGILLPIILIW